MTVLRPEWCSQDGNGVTTQRVRMRLSGQILSKQGISQHSGGLLRRRRSFRMTRVAPLASQDRRQHLGLTSWTYLRSRPARTGPRDRTELPGRRLASPGRRRRGRRPAERKGGNPRSQDRNLHADRAVRLARATSVAQRRLAADSPAKR